MKILLGLVCFFFSLTAFSQEGTKANEYRESHVYNKEVFNYRKLKDELDGTYQVKVINSDQRPLLSHERLQEIKKSRKENETVVLDLDDDMKIIVPSYNEISAPDFEPLEPTIYITTTSTK